MPFHKQQGELACQSQPQRRHCDCTHCAHTPEQTRTRALRRWPRMIWHEEHQTPCEAPGIFLGSFSPEGPACCGCCEGPACVPVSWVCNCVCVSATNAVAASRALLPALKSGVWAI
jgi:hypothetical protein